MPGTVRAVVFDIGEVLVSEARIWARWADRLGVSTLDFFAALGAAIERGDHHREVFDEFVPGFDIDAAIREDPAFGAFDTDDLYPDARPCLETLHRRGLTVGVAGNQPARAEDALTAMQLPVDFIASSERLGVEKPSLRFFERVAAEAGAAPAEVAYVGDRLDNDVLPSLDAGVVAVFIDRGPWGHIHGRRPEADRASFRIRTLSELPDLLAPTGR